ncbi:Isochorismatase of siderophore biosynthesis [Actinokineospora spheciospongiae]|uniref:Isochorismatase of siderophore biosynthesis n=1 Tax=Actinokineospora spheciospongiae TaxID=909613 RepID=W7ISF8_9PSEU|nr:phosphopantetheine-binding protein [Actinokineospora spheciospongiae]EWC63870.1 Isochorismatase of siderophore biosynthesis [Actinokineospora spheciospongiae]
MSTPETALTAERLRADVADVLGCDPAEVTPDVDLFDLGLDSMRTMALVERWRAAGAPAVEFADLAEEPRLERWTSLVTGAGT